MSDGLSVAPTESSQQPSQVSHVPDFSMLYNEYYYAHDCGIPYERNDHWMTFFAGIARNIARKLQPKTMLDAGCAMGLLVEQLYLHDIDVHGIDISEYAIGKAPEAVRDRVHVASLADPIEGWYDLVVTVEVIEHIPDAQATAALDNLCAVTNAILFSSSPHDYAEATHINVKSPDQWSVLFAERGFFRDVDHDASYLTPWAVLYRRGTGNVSEIVCDYERVMWTTRTENLQLRGSLLDFQRRLEVSETALSDAVVRSAAEVEASDAHQIEIFETRNALLVCRDTIANLEAGIGLATGERDRLASFAASRQDAVTELELMRNSRLWKLVTRVAAPVRKFRAR